MSFLELLAVGLAAASAPTLTPSDGVLLTGPAEPAWAWHAQPVAVPASPGPLADALDEAWRRRAALDPDGARRALRTIEAGLVPTLTTEQRDVLQRALFLDGLLELDAAGSAAALPDGTDVGGSRIPAAWLQAIAVSPGASAPAATDAAAVAQAYDTARTQLVAAGGPVFDPGAPDLDVRLDGAPIRDRVALLPGVHTLALIRPGEAPLALSVRVGPHGDAMAAEALQAELDAWTAWTRHERAPDDATRAALHTHYGTPKVVVRTDEGSRALWLVDGAARWGAPRLAAGVEGGVWGLAGAWSATPAGCSGTDEPQKLLVPVGATASLRVGAWRVRAGGGLVVDAGADAGFAVLPEVDCGGYTRPDAERLSPWGWAAAGWRVRVGAHGEVEPSLRVGATSTLLVPELVLRIPLTPPGLARVELSPHAGLAYGAWSGPDARAAFTGGLETTLLLGGS